MFYRIEEIKLAPDQEREVLFARCAEVLGVMPEEIERLSIFRRSLDARRGKIQFVFAVDVFLKAGVRPRNFCGKGIMPRKEEEPYRVPAKKAKKRPVVVGFGPAGMFCALVLAKAGLCPIVLERGKSVEERLRDVRCFEKNGSLDPNSNVLFGEGGAGTFSDGKLNTLIKEKNHRGRFVLETLVRFGAPEEILWQNKPHVGSDRLRMTIPNLRREIEALGGKVDFGCKMDSLILENGRVAGVCYEKNGEMKTLEADAVFLAIGHSARDTFRSLAAQKIPMENKIFSVGVRIEHLQRKINLGRYRKNAGFPGLPNADYKLAVPTKTGKTLYTFCMCPGGTVSAAASEPNTVVTNGMSDFLRDGENANAALLVSFAPEEFDPALFSGMAFQEELERKAFRAGGGGFRAPAQTVGAFLKNQNCEGFGSVCPTYPRGVTPARLDEILPVVFCAAMREGIGSMNDLLPGFADPDAVLTGVESRTTSPVRIRRGENYQSDAAGLYPLGEGAGYAGGIMSSAIDGLKGAECYLSELPDA